MMLNRTFRRLQFNYQKDGFVLVKKALSAATIDVLRQEIETGSIERKEFLLDLPRTVDIFKQNVREADPLYVRMREQFRRQRARRAKSGIDSSKRRKAGKSSAAAPSREQQQRHQRRSLEQQQRDAGRTAAAADDAYVVSRRAAERLIEMQSNPQRYDPQLRAAVNRARVNLWMTRPLVEEQLRKGELGSAARRIVEQSEVGLRSTHLSVFADRPFFRDKFCRPTLFHFAAPFIGIKPAQVAANSCMIWCMTGESATGKLHVLPGTHHEIGAAYGQRVAPKEFNLDFLPMDSHMMNWLKRFPTSFADARAQTVEYEPGDCFIFHPFLMMAMGPNFTPRTNSSLQLLLIDREQATPSLQIPSFLPKWRSTTSQIDFGSEAVFPPLPLD